MGWRGVFAEWRRSSCPSMGLHYNSARLLIFSCDQAALRTPISVRPSVCPSVCHSFLTMFLSSYHLEIFRSYYHPQTWCPCKRSKSKVKVTEVMTSFSRFRTVTSVWYQYGDEMMHKAWCCLGEVPYCVSRSSVTFQGHTALTIAEFDPDWAFPDCNSSLNSPVATK